MEALYNLGIMYQDGQGVRQNYFKAGKVYKKACNGNYYPACNNLGLLYNYGQGVRKNRSKAKHFLGKACDGGENIGCENYAKLNR